eukprot:2865363-Rhodomonas_salina.1
MLQCGRDGGYEARRCVEHRTLTSKLGPNAMPGLVQVMGRCVEVLKDLAVSPAIQLWRVLYAMPATHTKLAYSSRGICVSAALTFADEEPPAAIRCVSSCAWFPVLM